MDFRFNFQFDDSVSSNHKKDELKIKSISQEAHQASNIFTLKETLARWSSNEECILRVVPVGDEDFYILSDFQSEIDQNSDRIVGVYEGGLKVWECSVDLARFICEGKIEVKDKFVCELGCGAGLPGMAAAYRRCGRLLFQDFNDYVLTNCTAPSLCCNCLMRQREFPKLVVSASEIKNTSLEVTNFLFVSGDWENCYFSDKADVILTAETIYDVNNYVKLHDLLDRCLASCGTVYVASKAFYFGVGGGTYEWLRFCESRGVFNAEISHCVDAPLKRFIIKMTRKT